MTTNMGSLGEPVEVVRRRLRFQLRQARERACLTQKEAADQQGWSLSKIVRLELGAVLPAPADVRSLLSLYGVADTMVVSSMTELARRAREARGYGEYSDVYASASIELFGNESAAKVIYKYEPNLIPGLFQTEDYAREVLSAYEGSSESAARVTRKLEVRLARQQILENDPRPEMNFVIGEAAICIPAGTSQIMRQQLRHLCSLAEYPGITIQLLPFTAGIHRGLGEAFTILQFDESLADLLYLEGPQGADISRDDVAEIRQYLDRFAELQVVAAPPDEFTILIEKTLEQRFPE